MTGEFLQNLNSRLPASEQDSKYHIFLFQIARICFISHSERNNSKRLGKEKEGAGEFYTGKGCKIYT